MDPLGDGERDKKERLKHIYKKKKVGLVNEELERKVVEKPVGRCQLPLSSLTYTIPGRDLPGTNVKQTPPGSGADGAKFSGASVTNSVPVGAALPQTPGASWSGDPSRLPTLPLPALVLAPPSPS